MSNQFSFNQRLLLGLTLFSMFFGAGNLIFPPYLGSLAGVDMPWAMAGFAITAIFYFLVMKGAKGASFMRPEWISWIDANTLAILLVLFVGLSLLFQALDR